MKKMISAFLIITVLALSFSSCMLSYGRGSIVQTSLTLRNSTDYEIKSFGLQFWGNVNIERVNPMEYPSEKDTSIKSGEEREFIFHVGTNELPEAWGVNLSVTDAEKTHSFNTVSFEGASGYDITFYGYSEAGDPQFLFTAFEDVVNSDLDADESDTDAVYWNGFNFGPNLNYNEEFEIEADPGEYLSAAEGAKLTFDAMKENGNIPEYSDAVAYEMILVDLTDVEGEECYVYRLDSDEQTDTIGAGYAYAYQSGNMYMQGQGGLWVIPE